MPDLIEKWQYGDTVAFETLFRQYEKLVYRTAFLITGNREAAEDTLQEVFISVWRFRHTFNPEKSRFTTWLHHITVNQCSKERRRKSPTAISFEKTAIDAPEASHHDQPEEIMISKMEYDQLLKAMEALDTRHRSVLVLRYFNDLSYGEMAEVVGVPIGTIKSRLNKALKLLREQFTVWQREASA